MKDLDWLLEKQRELEQENQQLKKEIERLINSFNKNQILHSNEILNLQKQNQEFKNDNEKLRKEIQGVLVQKVKVFDDYKELKKKYFEFCNQINCPLQEELKEKIRNRIKELEKLIQKQFDKLGMTIDIDDFVKYIDTKGDMTSDTLILAQLIKELNSLLSEKETDKSNVSSASVDSCKSENNNERR